MCFDLLVSGGICFFWGGVCFLPFFNLKFFGVFYKFKCIYPYGTVSRFTVWRNQFNVKKILLQNPGVSLLTWSRRWSHLLLSKKREGEKNFLSKRAAEERRCVSSILNQNSALIFLLECYIMIRYIMTSYKI